MGTGIDSPTGLPVYRTGHSMETHNGIQQCAVAHNRRLQGPGRDGRVGWLFRTLHDITPLVVELLAAGRRPRRTCDVQPAGPLGPCSLLLPQQRRGR